MSTILWEMDLEKLETDFGKKYTKTDCLILIRIKTYPWESVILNDLNPLRTNFLNVIQNEPIKLIKKLIETDLSFINQPNTKKRILNDYQKTLEKYAQKRS